MTLSLAPIDAAAAPVRGFEGADLPSLTRPQLLDLLKLASAARDEWSLVIAQVANEVARRSDPQDGPGGLARQEGFGSAEQLVASVMGAAPGEGFKLVRAGKALSEERPLGEGLRNSAITVDKVDLIARTLAPLEGDTSELEARLTRAAGRLDYRKLSLMCRSVAARFDAEQTQERERRQHKRRSLSVTEREFGQVHIEGNLPAVQGAILITFLEAQVKAAFQAKREGAGDDRTAEQIRADALVALAAHGLDCTSPATGVKATVIMRVDSESAATGTGLATCDAISTPLSMSAFHQLCMDAAVIPVTVDSDGRCLDFGRERRLFSWAQRMALAERDGGCAKCHAPISYCITHHIIPWQYGGRTDLRNGVLLCVRCHTQVHYDHWGIEVDAHNQVWFTPPTKVDPERRRILGGAAALAIA